MKVAICVPCRDEVMSGFCFDLARLVGYEAKRGQNEIQLLQMPGTLIFTQREKLAQEALEWGADQVLWIDSDQRFPADTLEILQARQVPICGVNATTRREPILPTALNLKIEREMLNGKPGEPKQVWHKVESRGKKGVEQVTAVGFAVTLVNREVFEKIPRPWFDVIWTDHGNVIGEDVTFCVRCMENDIPVYVDHELSMHIGHIGVKTFGWDDVKHGPSNLRRPENSSRKLSRKKRSK
jgi:hypothetical protein